MLNVKKIIKKNKLKLNEKIIKIQIKRQMIIKMIKQIKKKILTYLKKKLKLF